MELLQSYTADTIILAWDMLQKITLGVATHPLRLAGKQSTKVNQPLYLARCLIVRPHADSSKLSYRASVASPALPKSAAGQILPKCGYYAGILLPKMRVRSIQNAGI